MPPPKPGQDETVTIINSLQDVMSAAPEGGDRVKVSPKLLATFRRLGPFNIEKLVK
jgi:hypothetical protein